MTRPTKRLTAKQRVLRKYQTADCWQNTYGEWSVTIAGGLANISGYFLSANLAWADAARRLK